LRLGLRKELSQVAQGTEGGIGMTEDFGACVVAIPYETDLHVQVDGGPHITLAYFGETLSNSMADELKAIVSDVANSWDFETAVIFTDELVWFGPDNDARVITFEGEDSPLTELLKRRPDWITPALMQLRRENDTYPIEPRRMPLGLNSERYSERETPLSPTCNQLPARAVCLAQYTIGRAVLETLLGRW